MLSKEHIVRNPSERNVGSSPKNKAAVRKQFNRADMLLQEVVAAITNGYTRNDIEMMFLEKKFENQKKPIHSSQASNYINMAYRIMQEDRVTETDKLRDQLYAQYMMLYNDCVLGGNNITAKQVLDSIAKIFLPQTQEKASVEVTKGDDKIKISFGYNETTDDTEDDDRTSV